MTNSAREQDPKLLRRLLRAKDRMDAASHEAWPIERLAAVSNVSETHFARSFKLAFGVPAHRYLLTRRIERALALLRDTDMPITDAALVTGWQSLGTFGRTFRDVTGQTPTETRLAWQSAAHQLGSVPECIVTAAHRPVTDVAATLVTSPSVARATASSYPTSPEHWPANWKILTESLQAGETLGYWMATHCINIKALQDAGLGQELDHEVHAIDQSSGTSDMHFKDPHLLRKIG
jgi:AraC-like DNA-binding protein